MSAIGANRLTLSTDMSNGDGFPPPTRQEWTTSNAMVRIAIG